jgi:hypothetical protein
LLFDLDGLGERDLLLDRLLAADLADLKKDIFNFASQIQYSNVSSLCNHVACVDGLLYKGTYLCSYCSEHVAAYLALSLSESILARSSFLAFFVSTSLSSSLVYICFFFAEHGMTTLLSRERTELLGLGAISGTKQPNKLIAV